MFGAAETETRKTALRESAAKQAGILLPALAASTAYTLVFSAMVGNLDDIPTVLATVALFTAPFELIMLLRKSRVGLPVVHFGGALGFVLLCVTVGIVLFAPIFAFAAIAAIAEAVDQAYPFISKEAIVVAFELLPLGQLAFIAVQLVRSALVPNGASR